MVLLLMERAPSGVGSPLSGMASSPKPGVIIIVAAINGRVTTKQCFVGFGSGSRGDLKREQVPLGRQK